MFGLSLLRHLPPGVTACAFYYGLPIVLAVRFLVGTVRGVFVLSVALYSVMWLVGEPKPFTLTELLLWLDELAPESKTAVVTTMLTVLGFLVAFHTATVNWKAQALAQLKQHVAGEIELFYAETSRLTTDAQIYARSLIEAVNSLQSQGASPDAIFCVRRALEKAEQFRATRDRLSAMSIEVHGISGRHYGVLSTVWGAVKTLEDCASALTEIASSMWIHVPIIPDAHPDPLGSFLAQVNVPQCMKFVTCCEHNSGFINGNSGGVRGALLAPIVGFNLSSRMSLAGKKAVFTEAMSKVRNRG